MRTRNSSIKSRLLGLTVLSILLVAGLLATSHLTDRKVDRAYQAMEAAQQTIQSARDAIEQAAGLKETVSHAGQEAMELRLVEKTYLQFRKAELKTDFDRRADLLAADLNKLKLAEVAEAFGNYRKSFTDLAAVHQQHGQLKGQMLEPLRNSEARLSSILLQLEAKQAKQQMEGGNLTATELELMSVTRDCRIVLLQLQNLQQQFLATGDQKIVQDYKKLASGDVVAQVRSLREFSSTLGNTNYVTASTEVSLSLNAFLKLIDQSVVFLAREKELEAALNMQGEAILKAAGVQLAKADQAVAQQRTGAGKAKTDADAARALISSAKRSSNLLIGVIVAIGLVAYGFACFQIICSINRSLRATIVNLDGSAGRTSEAAAQILSASQSLAEGASSQAASLEESSASLEEMTSMIRQNTTSAQRAKELAGEARAAADGGTEEMRQMTTAMGTIRSSSDDIAKIIRTIDEIAFQTNILALNAAVEAARAGQAGLGFAVVADEVRGLAQRSANAAKETAQKIEGAIANTAQGVSISTKVAQRLNEIVSRIRQVDDLVSQVAGASHEQSQGIQQITKAVSAMDRITQQNAAGAEESAAAASELSAQAQALKQAVAGLETLVTGVAATGASPASAHATQRPTEDHSSSSSSRQPIQPAAFADDAFEQPETAEAGRR